MPKPADADYTVYKRRWYVLVVYSLLAGTQDGVWNTFSPIAASAERAFGWDDSTIAMLSNWGPVSFLAAAVFSSWMLDAKGLRVACLLSSLLVALGTGLRCITMEPPAVTWLMHAGQALNGLAGPVAIAGAPTLSALWFPPRQRTTATAFRVLFSMVGVSASFVFGPMLVPDVSTNSTTINSTHHLHYYLPSADMENSLLNLEPAWTSGRNGSNPPADHWKEKEKKAIAVYMYIEAGWSLALFLLIVAYFPRRPPQPPSASATVKRENFFRGLRHLATRGRVNFWILAFTFGLSIGVFNVWFGVLDLVLKPHGITESDAGWIGFYAQCCGAAVSLIVARLSDMMYRKLKWLIISFYLLGTASFLVFILTVENVIPPSTALNAAIPLQLELACELAYPTGEGTTNGVLALLKNLAGILFLFIFMIPHIGSMWTNYTLLGSLGLCLVLLVAVREQYNRLEVDERRVKVNGRDTPDPSSPLLVDSDEDSDG